MVDSLTNLAITQLGQVTLLVALAGLAHRLLAARAPRWMLMMWTLVGIKAVTPPLFASPVGLFSWFQAPLLSAEKPGPLLTPAPWVAGGAGWQSVVLAVWAVGAAIAATTALVRHRRLTALLNRDALPDDTPLARYAAGLADRYGLRRPSRVVVSADELGPAVAGLGRPMLVLPASLVEERDPGALRPVLLHELVHLDRRDVLVALLHTTVRVVWWYHPAVWWAVRRAETLVERCVDLTVTRELETSVVEYGRGLVRVLELRTRLRPEAAVVGLRPCQITTDRLRFLRRQQEDGLPASTRSVVSVWGRGLAFAALAILLLPALPVDALAPGCDGPYGVAACQHPDPTHDS